MGYNTTIVVLNDQLDQIEKDPEFGKRLVAAIRSFSRSRPDRMPYVGQASVINVEHADMLQIVAIGGNTGRVIGYGFRGQSDDDLIKSLEADRKRRAKDAKKTTEEKE